MHFVSLPYPITEQLSTRRQGQCRRSSLTSQLCHLLYLYEPHTAVLVPMYISLRL